MRRALRAVEAGDFEAEIAPVTVKGRKGETVVSRDETPFTCDISKIPSLKPAFAQGRHGHRRQLLVDLRWRGGAVVMRESTAKARGLKPLARVLAYASHAHEPEWFTTAPVGAIRKTLAKLGWKPHDADLYEVNEAFAAVTMAAMRDVDIDHARMNVNGGACALGHPDRRHRRAHPDDAGSLRSARTEAEARHRLAVHRRRRSSRDGDRTRCG